MPIFGSKHGGHRGLIFGTYRVDTEDYIPVIKQYVTNTMAYSKYIHMLKMADEENRLGNLKWKNGVMRRAVADSVLRAASQKMLVKSDITQGHVK
jgi:hypothetical protein